MSGYLHFYAAQPVINDIAGALNTAGNLFHHTSEWNEKTQCLPDGKTCASLIQEKLESADRAHADLIERYERLKAHAEELTDAADWLQEEVSHVARFRDRDRHPKVTARLIQVRTAVTDYRSDFPKGGK